MPERLPTARPTVLAGTNLTSGDPNTGQVFQTFGGAKTFSLYSGTVGPDKAIWVGGGRLDHVELHPGAAVSMPIASGPAVIFYDSAVVVSGGPIFASGHKIVSKITPGILTLQSISSVAYASGILNYGGLWPVGRVFTSGLMLATLSGMNGVTVSFTPVVSGTNPNFP